MTTFYNCHLNFLTGTGCVSYPCCHAPRIRPSAAQPSSSTTVSASYIALSAPYRRGYFVDRRFLDQTSPPLRIAPRAHFGSSYTQDHTDDSFCRCCLDPHRSCRLGITCDVYPSTSRTLCSIAGATNTATARQSTMEILRGIFVASASCGVCPCPSQITHRTRC